MFAGGGHGDLAHFCTFQGAVGVGQSTTMLCFEGEDIFHQHVAVHHSETWLSS